MTEIAAMMKHMQGWPEPSNYMLYIRYHLQGFHQIYGCDPAKKYGSGHP